MRVPFAASFNEFFNSHMSTFSPVLFEVQAFLIMCKNERIDVGSDDLNTTDVISRSMRLAHFEIFTNYDDYIVELASTDCGSSNQELQ